MERCDTYEWLRADLVAIPGSLACCMRRTDAYFRWRFRHCRTSFPVRASSDSANKHTAAGELRVGQRTLDGDWHVPVMRSGHEAVHVPDGGTFTAFRQRRH